MKRIKYFLICFSFLFSSLSSISCSNDGTDESVSVETRTSGTLVIGDDTPNEIFYVGPLNRHFHTGPVIIEKSGLLLVWGGEFHIAGNDAQIAVKDDGRMIFKNSIFHMVQSYINQHKVTATENGSVEFHSSTVSADGSIDFYALDDNSKFVAKDTIWENWSTWFPSDQSSLTLDNVTFAGDIVISGAPTMVIKDSTYVMPWLQFPDGSAIDTRLPTPAPFPWSPISKIINNNVPGFSGIPWSLEISNSNNILWGIHPMPGSNVTIRDSKLASALFPFMGSDTYVIQGDFKNDTFYADYTFSSAPDRHLHLINTDVAWWKIDPGDDVVFYADDIIIAEMIFGNNAKSYITNSICEGQTVHIGATDSAYLHWKDGEIWTHVSAWYSATMVLENTIVDWTKQKTPIGIPQPNLAHNGARLYCLNTEFVDGPDADSEPDYLPEARDSAVVMYEKINYPASGTVVTRGLVNVLGSAWVKIGPNNRFLISFSSYELAYQRDGEINWTVFRISTTQIDDVGTLGVWDTRTIPAGTYKLRLTINTTGFPPKDPTKNFPLVVDNILVQ